MSNSLLIKGLYLLIIIQSSIFINTTFINLSLLSQLKYPYLIFISGVTLLFILKNNIKLLGNKINTSIIIFFLIILIFGTIFSMKIEVSLFRGFLAFITFFYIWALISIYSATNTLKYIFRFLLYLSYGIVFLSDFLLLINNQNIFQSGNFRSFFENSNSFASFVILFLIPVLTYQIINKKLVYINYFVLVNSLYLVFLAKSRSAILSLFIFFAVLFIIRYIYFRKNTIINNIKYFVSFLIILSIFYFNQDPIYKYFVKYEHIKSSNLAETRLSLWNDRIMAIDEKPLTGWGYGINYRDYSLILQKDWNYITGETEKGNTILSIFEEFGIFFGSIIILFITHFLYIIIKNIKYNISNNLNIIIFLILVVLNPLFVLPKLIYQSYIV